MARSLGLTVTPWSPLARGALAVRLDGKQLERLDAATRVRREYPYDFLYDRRTALASPVPVPVPVLGDSDR
ncbi:hypothetical protein ACIQWL_19975 [Streptomyces mirabilis]|uniref:hypothetical protein n=1 Tax=Streptomyces mirabilis TaxID=68239 RepID=UPI00382DF06D